MLDDLVLAIFRKRRKEVNHAVWRWNWTDGAGANDREEGRFLCWFWHARVRQPYSWKAIWLWLGDAIWVSLCRAWIYSRSLSGIWLSILWQRLYSTLWIPICISTTLRLSVRKEVIKCGIGLDGILGDGPDMEFLTGIPMEDMVIYLGESCLRNKR